MSSTLPRRPSIASAAAWGLVWTVTVFVGAPAVAAQDVPAEPVAAEVGADDFEQDANADGGGAFGTPAPPVSGRDRRRAMTETLWYLFFVTAGVLLGLVVIVWGLGWYKRAFLEEDALESELFDAAARAEIERHRKEVQAEHEAAKRAAETETTHAERETLPDADADADEPPPGGPAGSPRETLAEQTAAPPDPAVQRDADAR